MQDPFDRLGLEPRFDLDPAAIERAFLRAIAASHPDASAFPSDLAADAGSADLTEARRVLDDPERRANALLERLGGPGKADRSLPDGFLLEIMAVREEIDEAPDLERWSAWAEQRRANHVARVGEMFSKLQAGGSSGDSEAIRGEIRTELNAWRYAERLIEQLDPDYDPARADFA